MKIRFNLLSARQWEIWTPRSATDPTLELSWSCTLAELEALLS